MSREKIFLHSRLRSPVSGLAFPNYNQTSVRSRYRTADHEQIVLGVDAGNGQSLDGYLCITHVA